MPVLEFLSMNSRPTLVLASNSPRRKDLLALGGWDFEVSVSNADESLLANESPADYVVRLAQTKARTVALRAGSGQVVLAADTTVVDANEIMGKPADSAEAKRMLSQLRGHAHKVYTGIAALRVSDGVMLSDLCVIDVPMRNYTDDEIDAYIATGDPLDKAGAYGIQHARAQLVESMRGCYAGVMGLPMCHVTRLLRQLEIAPLKDVPVQCQALLKYDCPIFMDVLRA